MIDGSIQAYTQRYSAGHSIDVGTLQRNGQSTDFATISSAQTNAKGNITAQAVVSSSNPGQRIEVTASVGADNLLNFERPQTIVIKDTTNDGYIHTFTYQLCTPQELQGWNLTETDNNRSRDNHDEVYRLDLKKNNPQTVTTELDDGRIVNTTVYNYEYPLLQDDPSYPGYNKSSIDYRYSTYGRRRGR